MMDSHPCALWGALTRLALGLSKSITLSLCGCRCGILADAAIVNYTYLFNLADRGGARQGEWADGDRSG